jgi:deoxyribonuclease-4
METFDRAIGLERLKAFHLNDSVHELGSGRDRHAHIGEGSIGLEGFRNFVNDPRLADLPGLLETDKSADLHEDIENLARLRSLIA